MCLSLTCRETSVVRSSVSDTGASDRNPTPIRRSLDDTNLDPSHRLALPLGIKTALRRLHVNLGHATNDGLTRCLAARGGTHVAQRTVKGLRCSTCERMSRPRSQRPSRLPTDGERFNEELLVDLCDLVDVRGNRYGWLVAVDQPLTTRCLRHCSLWQKGRVEQPSRKWRTRRFGNIKWRVSAVSHEVVHVGNQRAGGWELTSNTSLQSANEGLPRTDGTRRGHFPFDRGKRKKRAVKTFHLPSISARGLGKTGHLERDQENRFLVSAVLMEPQNRSCWFDGRAYSYAAEHLRGVVSGEGDRLGIDERRQEDKRLNNEDSTFRSRRPSSVEVSTEPPRELEESSRDDLDIEARLCPRRTRQAPRESSTAPGRTVQETRCSFGMTKAYPTVWPLPSRTRRRRGGSKPACLELDRPEVPCLRLARRYLRTPHLRIS